MQANANIKSKSVFNLWEGKGYKSNLLKYAKDSKKYHPTQKPIKLLEDLINTFSKGGDTVCDLTMGSGSKSRICKNIIIENCFYRLFFTGSRRANYPFNG